MGLGASWVVKSREWRGPQGCRLEWGHPRFSCVWNNEYRTVTSVVFVYANLSLGVPLLFQAGAVNKQGDSILCR